MLRHMSRELGKDFGVKSRQFFELVLPPTDIYEDGSDLVVVIDLPGFKKEDIKTRINESVFTVSAKRDRPERDGLAYSEQRPLRLSKRVPLPVRVELGEDEVKGKYEDGVLTIRLPVKGVGKVLIE